MVMPHKTIQKPIDERPGDMPLDLRGYAWQGSVAQKTMRCNDSVAVMNRGGGISAAPATVDDIANVRGNARKTRPLGAGVVQPIYRHRV